MKSKGLLFGIAIGDSLGVPVEFMSRKHLKAHPVVDMRAYGKGLYWVEIGDLNGNRITMCRLVIQ